MPDTILDLHEDDIKGCTVETTGPQMCVVVQGQRTDIPGWGNASGTHPVCAVQGGRTVGAGLSGISGGEESRGGRIPLEVVLGLAACSCVFPKSEQLA